ncbi:hypothetical protein [Bradyrhizobium sp. DASA03120]|uniref:hypothetical protein n=1 Tax=Bradyrhizobium sp. SMVTL-02 TaxID=3395917 RepID=UPI003F713BC4
MSDSPQADRAHHEAALRTGERLVQWCDRPECHNGCPTTAWECESRYPLDEPPASLRRAEDRKGDFGRAGDGLPPAPRSPDKSPERGGEAA